MYGRIGFASAWIALSPGSALSQDGPCDVRWPGKAASFGVDGVDFDLVDVDQDGGRDLLAVAESSGDVVFLRAVPSGFGPPTISATGATAPSGFGVGDLDGDGAPDVVITRSEGDALTVGFGDGKGGLLGATSVPATSTVHRPVLADLDEDGDLDVILRHTVSGDLEIRRGDGAGGLGAPETYDAFSLGDDPLVVDLDADGDADVLATVLYSADSWLLRSDGSGGYASTMLATTPYPIDFVAIDVDDDGRDDLVQVDAFDGLTLLRSEGGLDFAPPESISSIADPRGLRRGDVDGDGDQDLMLVGATEPVVCVHRQVGDGFAAAESIETMTTGNVRLFAAGPAPGAEARLLMTKRGTALVRSFTAAAPGAWRGERVVRMTNSEPARDVGVVDLDADGDLELVACSEYGVYLAKNLGGRQFGPSEMIPSPFDPSVEGAFGDVDGDGDLDAIVSSKYRCTLFRGAGTGALGSPQQVDYQYGALDSALRDIDHDGDLDVVTAGSAGVAIARGDGKSGFMLPVVVPGTSGAGGLAIADLDGDGALDVAYSGAGPCAFGVVFGAGGPTAHGETIASWSAPLGEIAAGDLDSNGTLDLVAGVVGGPGVVLLPGTGGGAFGAPSPLDVDPAGAVTEIEVVDVDGDALEDLVVGKGNGGIAVRRGTGLGSLAPPDLRGPFQVGSVAIGDVDGDGRLDAVSAGSLPPATIQFGEPVGWWTSLGVGCPGLGGHAPSLSIPACHDPSTQLGIRLEGGPGGAPALVLVGDAAPAMPIGWSLCSLGVDVTQVLPVPLGGSGPGNGAAVLLFAVPPSAQGLSFALQAAVKDEVSLPGFTMTNTLAFTLP